MRITEPSITAEMKSFLEERGINVFPPEVSPAGHRRTDVLFRINGHRFVLECEIGEGYDKLIEGIQQVSQYERDLRNQGISTTANIVIIYPPSVRIEVRTEEEANNEIQRILKTERIKQAIMLPPYIDFPPDLTLEELLKKLTDEFREKELSINFITKALNETVDIMEAIILSNMQKDKTILDLIVNNFNFFKVILTDKVSLSSHEIYKQVARLGGYVLINQILFYHLLSNELRKRGDFRLSELTTDITIEDLKDMFTFVVEDIDYDPIFTIDIIGHLSKEYTDIVRQVINVIRSIKPEIIKHDLLGIIYHNLIPRGIRKTLAAFFTIPVAAEILTSLVIEDKNETVLDPACGSGTILASAYRKKMLLAKSAPGYRDSQYPTLHKEFVENHISGVDIMPFSAHLSAMNLTIQAPFIETQIVRIGVDDFIRMNPNKSVGALVGDLTPVLFPEYGEVKLKKEDKVKKKPFRVIKVDNIIMNPPFTKKRRLTEEMKIPIRKRWWSNLGSFPYWGHFLFHSLSFIKKNGKIGAVLPLGAIALKDGIQILREFKKKGFKPKLIVKSMKNIAFSESAKFRDFLITFDADKERTHIGFVYLKKSLEELNLNSAREIGDCISSLRIGENFENDNISVIWYPLNEIHPEQTYWEILELNDLCIREIKDFYLDLFFRNDRLIKFNDLISEDQITYFSPTLLNKGTRHSIFIGRDASTRTKLLIKNETKNNIICYLKNSDIIFRIPKDAIMISLKTGSYVSSIDASEQDFFIKKRFRGFEDIERTFGAKVNFEAIAKEMERMKGNLSINRRFDFTAEGFRLFAYYSDTPMVTTEMLWTIGIVDVEVAKILALWFNSSIFMLNLIVSKRKETRGSFSQTDKYKILEFPILDIDNLSVDERNSLLNVFDQIRSIQFPPFIEQLKNKDPNRVLLDKEMLRILGYEENELDNIISLIYKVLLAKCEECLFVMKNR
ncbi:MAG: N-6 DNA methylase [Candidatus Helarchaeota archaeon]